MIQDYCDKVHFGYKSRAFEYLGTIKVGYNEIQWEWEFISL